MPQRLRRLGTIPGEVEVVSRHGAGALITW
jgi:hypothetical protein